MANKKETEAISAYVNTVEEETNALPSNNNEVKYNDSHLEKPLNNTSYEPVNYRENMGYLKIDMKSLPTQGIFYPNDMEIMIRAARGEEIKHWSTMNDQDIMQISRTDDILNYMIERCCSVKIPGRPGNCWQDLKSIDRFYILLSIKEFTFLKGENQLYVPNDKEDIPVTKEMIDFVDIPEDIMKFFSHEEKCFIFTVNGKTIKIYIPSLGVNAWLKNYATNKENTREFYDRDFLNYAPMLIKDYRNLSQRAYEDFVSETQLWGVREWSVLTYVTDKLNTATEPKIKYTDDGGTEKEIPLSFRGGIKSIFVISNPLQSLC